MGKYIKKFDTHSDYEDFIETEDFIKPNVSYCVDNVEVHYNPIPDPYGGHEYVEIGGIKWATMNIGAENVTDTGLYFQWGDTQGYTANQIGSEEGKKYFGWADYKYGNGTSRPNVTDITKYNSTDGKTVLEAADDAVTAAWGGSWKTPTKEDFDMLISAVNTEFVNDYQNSGIPGLVLTDKTDESKVLFFPAAGCAFSGNTNGVNSSGHYWSSSVVSEGNLSDFNGYKLYFNDEEINLSTNTRYFGFPIRGVAD